MKYLMSDVHGEYEKFKEMIRLIGFNREKDRLYIIGDLFDRGSTSGVEILCNIKEYLQEGSMVLIKGNHEYFAQQYIEGVITPKRYSLYGGELSMADIDRLSEDVKKKLYEYLKHLPLYCEIDTTRYGKLVLTHTGPMIKYLVYDECGRIDAKKSIDKAVVNNEYKYLINIDMYDMSLEMLNKIDKFMVVGHVRTYTINKNASSKICRTPYFINIDSGAGQGNAYGALSCYCVDTDEEFYI